MNATREDEKNHELNLLVKMLGRRGKESEQWKNADQDYWKISLNLLSEILSKASSTGSIVLRPYGSAAEDLKSEEADDFGDVDIMMFPNSPDLLIHDELIEYLPQNPLYVRIKGVNHPLLKFCCVEDMDYVSTSAVKDSYVLIFGDVGKSIATTAFKFLSREEPTCPPPFTCCYKDSNDSPAVKFNILLPPDTDIHSSSKLQNKESLVNASEFPAKTKHVQESETNIDDRKTQLQNEDLSENSSGLKREEHSLGRTTDVTQNPSYSNEDGKAHTETKRIKGVTFLCKHMYPNGSEKAELRTNYVEAGIDFVPALRSPGWPKVAQEWIRRERKWPSSEIVGNVIKDGFHLVVKSPKAGGNPNCDFRISFSHAEYLLSQEMNDIQRECYRCLKKYHRAYLSKHPKGLVTFHLKIILLQTIEEIGSDVWTESNQAECLMKLLDNLLKALSKKHLPHFFVKTYNMFCVDYIENPEVLESLASKVEQIMQNPMQFAQELIQIGNSQGERQFQKERGPGREFSKHATDKQAQKDEKNEETPCSDDAQTGTQIKQTKESHEGTSPFARKRHEDLKVSFLAISNELTDIAFNEHEGIMSLKLLDPLETSLVQDIREMQKQLDFTREDFSEMFELMGNSVYLKILLSTEPNKRRRILHGIQSALENFKYVLRHYDDETGSVEALSLMLDPAAEDPFDLSNIIPAGGGTQLVRMFTGNYPPKSRSDKPPVDLNDIPLD